MSGSRDAGGSMRRLCAAVILSMLLTAASVAWGKPLGKVVDVRHPMTGQVAPAVEGSVIVKPRPGVPAARIQALIDRIGATVERPLMYGEMLLIQLPRGMDTFAGARQLLDSSLLEFAEPNYIMVPYAQPGPQASGAGQRPMVVPSDPLWAQQWGPQKIECPEAWDFEKGDPSVIIAIIDEGMDYNHEDLAGHMWQNAGEIPGDAVDNDGNGYVDDVYGYDFVDDDGDPINTSPTEDHGTHVAGTASADTDNGVGVAGVAWFGSLMSCRVLGPTGGTTADVVEGINYAVDNGAAVINMSLGPPVPVFDNAFTPPIDRAYSMGVTVVCAAGNSYYEITTDPSTWFSPVCNDGVDPSVDNHVLGVMATDMNDLKADFSNYGDAYRMMDVCAPGVGIWSTIPGDNYQGPPIWDGTSMASPHAAGLAALLVAQIGRDPGAIIDQIRTTATDIDPVNPLYAGKLGTGRISAAAAVGLDLPPEPATAVNAFDSPGDEGGSLTVTWRKSADDGAGRNDVIGYELWRGQAPDPSGFTMVAGLVDLPPGSSGYKDEDPTLVDGSSYYYFVRTRDAAASADSAVAGPASPRDDSAPPTVDTLVAQDSQGDEGRSITLLWPGYTGAPDITEFRVYRSTAEFTDVTEEGVEQIADVTPASARQYIDAVPLDLRDDPELPPKDLTDYWYAVTAVDEANNEITAVTAAGPVQCAPNLSFTFTSELQMIAVPAQPIDGSPMAFFGISDPSEMKFARYDPLLGAYHTLSAAPADPALTIMPGRGFWLQWPAAIPISIAGFEVEDPEYVVALDQGWNIVGSAYNAAYPFVEIDVRDPFGTDEDITASNDVRKYAWRYDAFERSYKLVSGATPEGTPLMPNGQANLPAQEAMWVYALVPGMSLVFHNNVAVAAAAAPADRQADLGGWQLQLVARTANAADTDNFIGVSAKAKEIGTIVSPPPIAGGVDLFLAGDKGARTAVDLREALGGQAKWVAVVECGAANADVELSWPELGLLPAHVKPILKDCATGRTVYMRTAKSYDYRSRRAGGQRRFEITVEGPDYRPVALQLAAAPNGAGGAEITYTLNRAAKVRTEIRNLAGRLVATLAEQDGKEGLNRLVWNGMAANGTKVPGGRYILLLTAVAEDNGETVKAVRAVTIGR